MEDKQKSGILKKFENGLSDLVNSYAPLYQKEVSGFLKRNYALEFNVLFDMARKHYSPSNGRWYDSWHVPESTLSLMQILDASNISYSDKIAVFAAFAYHDSGYPVLENTDKYNDFDVRDLHQRVGAAKAYLDLSNLKNNDGKYFVDRETLSNILNMVLFHDDKFFGKEYKFTQEFKKLFSLMKDADSSFIPSGVSSWKDYVSRYCSQNGGHLRGEEFVRLRQSYFFKQGEEAEYNQTIRITDESNEKCADKYLEISSLKAKEIIGAHLLGRTKDVINGKFDLIYNGDWDGFKPTAEAYLKGSIESAKNGKTYDSNNS